MLSDSGFGSAVLYFSFHRAGSEVFLFHFYFIDSSRSFCRVSFGYLSFIDLQHGFGLSWLSFTSYFNFTPADLPRVSFIILRPPFFTTRASHNNKLKAEGEEGRWSVGVSRKFVHLKKLNKMMRDKVYFICTIFHTAAPASLSLFTTNTTKKSIFALTNLNRMSGILLAFKEKDK